MESEQLHPGNAIWADGEWISWDEINQGIHDTEEAKILERLLQIAKDYFAHAGRPLPVYGEIGELYAERRYGIERHRIHAQGSDGRIGDDFVEVKTITPFKGSDVISVRRDGHFNKLVVVRVNEEHQIDSRIIDRKQLPKGTGKFLKVSWDHLPS